MSERKSWDVQPKRQSARAAAPQGTRRVAVDTMRPLRRAPAAPVRAPRPAARPASGRLRDRRKQARKTGLIISSILLALLIGAGIYSLWLPALRIQEIRASGPAADMASATARQSLKGTYAYIIPRDSIFFFPKDAVRKAVLSAHSDIAALSIARASFTSITLSGTPRVRSFVWCGTGIDLPFPDGQCFEADAEGLIFRQADISTTTLVLSTGSSTPATAGDLRIFSPLGRELDEGESPVGIRVTRAESIPEALRFVKAIRGLGIPVSSLVLREDEADLWLSGPTRITYVLGREESAAQLAASVIPTLSLTDGSIAYLDLRFSGRAYVKRHGE